MAVPVTPPDQESNFKEFEHFTMFTNSPGLENIRARWVWSAWRGNPRVSVFTGHKDEATGKMQVLSAAMDPDTFEMMMLLTEKIMRAEPGTAQYIENYTREKMEPGSDKLGAVIHKSDTWVGKDKEGYIWWSVREPNKPEIVFRHVASMFHKFKRGNGEEVPPIEVSMDKARATVNNLRKVFTPLIGVLKPPYDPNAPKPQRGGGKFPQKGQAVKKDYADLDDISF